MAGGRKVGKLGNFLASKAAFCTAGGAFARSIAHEKGLGLPAQPAKAKTRTSRNAKAAAQTTTTAPTRDESAQKSSSSATKKRTVSTTNNNGRGGRLVVVEDDDPAVDLIEPLFDFGASISDVVRFWVHVCQFPSVLFSQIDLWNERVTLNSGVVQIYSIFADFSHRLHAALERDQKGLVDGGIDLQAPIEGGISYEDIYPSDVERSKKDAAADEKDSPVKRSGPYESSLNLKISSADISKSGTRVIGQKAFWDVTKYLLGTRPKDTVHGVVVHQTKIELPNRHDMTMLVRTLGQRMFQLTQPLQPAWMHVPAAYTDPLHHQLFLVITPNMRKSSRQEDCVLCIYDTTANGGVHNLDSQLSRVRWGDLGHHPAWSHPVLQQACWRDLIFKVASLASYRSLYINYNFHVGHHYQYLDVFEQCFDLVRREELPHVDGSHQGGFKALWKATIEEDDVDSGTCPHWIYEFDVTPNASPNGDPDMDPVGGGMDLSSALPTYKGMRVRFMFRRDYTSWFF